MSKVFLLSCLLLIFSIFPKQVLAHAPETHKVTIDKDGFKPENVRLKQGDKLVFVNLDSEEHWPASDIHPTHLLYQEFDPKRGLAPSESWGFTFTRVGQWRFHDHINPRLAGMVEVVKDADFTTEERKIKETPKKTFFDLLSEVKMILLKRFYEIFPDRLVNEVSRVKMHQAASDDKQITYYLRLLGAKRVMEKLVSDSGGGSVLDCHQEAHRIGRIAYEIYGPEAFEEGDSSCHSGFYHGAMEAFLVQKGTENLASNIDSLCKNFSTSFGNFECLHGVGHGVMAYLSYSLPESLEECEKLNGGFAQSSCSGGVFMENVVTAEGRGAGSTHKTDWVNDDPHFPCNAVAQDDTIQTQCYLMQTSRMLDLSGHDFSFVTSECMKAPERLRGTCFQSEGRDAAGQTLRDPGKILEICSQVPAEYQSRCLQGALYVIVEFWGEKMDDHPHELCRQIKSESQKRECYAWLSYRLVDVLGDDVSEKQKSCSYMEKPYQEFCRRTAGLNS